MRVRDYRGPLGVLAAGAIGLSLLCSVSVMAMSDLENQVRITIEPLNIVDFAVSNLNTAAAFTQQAVTQFVPTPTLVPTNTSAPSVVPSDTPRHFVTITPTLPRRTREPLNTQPPVPPARTNTPLPPPTKTLVPPTLTPVPDTPTSEPPPTEPPPTEPPTSEPPTAEPALQSSVATDTASLP